MAGSASVKVADAFCLYGSHVVLFATQVDADGLFTSYEANGSAGQVIVRTSQSYSAYSALGYQPWCSLKLKDDPAADVFAFCAGRESGRVRVTWQTLLERSTESFVVERGESAEGPFVAVSDELPHSGKDAGGATYEFIDTSYPGGAVYYQLREIETTGHELLHGVVGPVDLAAGGGGH